MVLARKTPRASSVSCIGIGSWILGTRARRAAQPGAQTTLGEFQEGERRLIHPAYSLHDAKTSWSEIKLD
jgi:hypothetical protein